MKNKKISLFLVLSLGCLLTNCSKESPSDSVTNEPIQSVFSKAPAIKSYTQVETIDEEFPNLISFLSDSDVKGICTSKSDITKVLFQDYPTLVGIQVSIDPDNSYEQKDLLSIYDSKTKNRFTLIREIEGFFNNETGSITFRSLDDSFILSNHYKDGVNISEYSSRQKDHSKKWNCTNEEFEEFYFAAKEECESDILCDIACVFNPCTLAYLAAAIIECATN